MLYRLNNISRNYGPTVALARTSITIPTDQFVFLIGPSGSGKSTLLRLLSMVEEPSNGTIELELNGNTYSSGISGMADRPWPEMTCVFQKQFLWPHKTIKENILLPLQYTKSSSRADSVIDLFEMRGFVDRYPNEVSGGQAQRAALARALALNPSLILIDEAHGGLDIEQQSILNSHLLQLRQSGIGLIVVTHSLEFVRTFADFILVIEDGSVSESGGVEILDNPQSRFLKIVKTAMSGA